MTPSSFLRGLALILACSQLPLGAALEWDKKEISLEARRGTRDDISTRFTFRNTGPKAVTITGITTSCSCTEANPDHSKIAAGEASAIWALFTIGTRKGPQTKTITVTTDDPTQPEIVLTLKINLLDPAP